MPKFTFSFGPDGSFYLNTPYKWACRGLTNKLRDKLHSDFRPEQKFVSLGKDEEFFYGRTTHKGDVHSE